MSDIYHERDEPRNVYVGIGSNLGDRLANLQHAVQALPDVVAVSPVYETEPLGENTQDQRDHLNAVVQLLTRRSPQSLLLLAHDIEHDAGRVRIQRDGPRTLDIDLLLDEDCESNSPELTLPHPRMWTRGFVMTPLHDLNATLMPDDWQSLLSGERVRRTAFALQLAT